MPYLIAIVGRSNVGKSTLFNRLVGRKQAVVAYEPGTTRDFLAEEIIWRGKRLTVVDTAGIAGQQVNGLVEKKGLEMDILAQTEEALASADLIIFLTDGREGIQPQDKEAAEKIRKLAKPVILAVNKAEKEREIQAALPEFYQLGLGEPLPISAREGRGVGDLLDLVVKRLPKKRQAGSRQRATAIKVAILGKPNVGKSTLFNRLLGKRRSVVSPVPGTTRDLINEVVAFGDLKAEFIDTAGLRRKGKMKTGPELFSSLRSLRAIKAAEICLLLIDATEEISQQDKQIASYILREGRSLILVINKWDLPEKDETTMRRYQETVRQAFAFACYLPQIYLSALTGQGTEKLIPLIAAVKTAREKKLPAKKLTDFIKQATLSRRPIFRRKPVKIYYAKQIKGPSITIQLTANQEGLDESYKRYLENQLREKLDSLIGTPVFFRFKKIESRKGKK